jgi:hypothetical protein
MRKLLAFCGLGSSVVLAVGTAIPKLTAILLVLLMSNLNVNTIGAAVVSFLTGSSIAATLVSYSLGFFPTAGGYPNLFFGL